MNDFLSQLQKAGSWLWSQKEKMVLIALVGVLCYRVYVVVFPPDTKSTAQTTLSAMRPAAAKEPTLPTVIPPWPPNKQVMADASGLVRRNPFTIYGVQGDDGPSTTTDETTIPVTLTGFRKWRDGTMRALLLVSGDRVRPYAERESFGSYTLESIDADGKTVEVYSQEFDKVFTLQVQGGG